MLESMTFGCIIARKKKKKSAIEEVIFRRRKRPLQVRPSVRQWLAPIGPKWSRIPYMTKFKMNYTYITLKY